MFRFPRLPSNRVVSSRGQTRSVVNPLGVIHAQTPTAWWHIHPIHIACIGTPNRNEDTKKQHFILIMSLPGMYGILHRPCSSSYSVNKSQTPLYSPRQKVYMLSLQKIFQGTYKILLLWWSLSTAVNFCPSLNAFSRRITSTLLDIDKIPGM